MAITVTYTYPVAGVTPPTAAQAKDLVVASVVASADGDTVATITHNFGLTAAQLAAGFPLVSMTLGPLGQALAASSGWSFTSASANAAVFTKLATVGSGSATAQLIVALQRPHSIIGQSL